MTDINQTMLELIESLHRLGELIDAPPEPLAKLDDMAAKVMGAG